ncbi:HNH endonuclease signature motif containing protein [Streptomyces sp. NPDC054956]
MSFQIGPTVNMNLTAPPPWYMTKCMIWPWGSDGHGYGVVSRNGRNAKVHRVMYELVRGPVPEGLELDHLCRRRACFNPEHLEAVTRQINVLRGVSPAAKHALVTHCPQGHLYDEANTAPLKRGRRGCRACSRESSNGYNRAKKIQAMSE